VDASQELPESRLKGRSEGRKVPITAKTKRSSSRFCEAPRSIGSDYKLTARWRGGIWRRFVAGLALKLRLFENENFGGMSHGK